MVIDSVMQNSRAKKIGENLICLAELLSDEDCEITAKELLENIEGRAISKDDALLIRIWLST